MALLRLTVRLSVKVNVLHVDDLTGDGWRVFGTGQTNVRTDVRPGRRERSRLGVGAVLRMTCFNWLWLLLNTEHLLQPMDPVVVFNVGTEFVQIISRSHTFPL